MTPEEPGRGGPEGHETAWRVVRSLRRVPEWRLTPAQWEAVGAAVRDIAGLWHGEDRRGLRAAAGRLELAGPRMVVTKHQDEPLRPPPVGLPDELNELVTCIVAETGEPTGPGDAPPGGGAEADGR